MSAGTIDRSTIAVVRGSGGTPGTIGRSTVAVVRGAGGTPGTIGRSTVAVVLDTDAPVYARVSVSMIIGAVAITAAPLAYAYASVSRVIGAAAIFGGPAILAVRASVSRVIGSVNLLASTTKAARINISRVIGKIRLLTTPLGSPWTEPWTPEDSGSGAEFDGLPCPTLEGYQYQNAPGLVRTEMESGVVRQRKRWGLSVRPALARVVLTAAQLVQMEAVFVAVGAAWWNLPMVTGTSAGAVAMHSVRLSGPVQVRALAADVFEVLMPLEIQ